MSRIMELILEHLTRDQLVDIVREAIEPPNPFGPKDELDKALTPSEETGVPQTLLHKYLTARRTGIPTILMGEPGLGKSLPAFRSVTDADVNEVRKGLRKGLKQLKRTLKGPRKPSAKAKAIVADPKVWENRAYQAMRYADKESAHYKTKSRRAKLWNSLVAHHRETTRKKSNAKQFAAYSRIIEMGRARRGY